MRKVRVYSIKWDTDGDMELLKKLPTSIEMDISMDMDEDEIEFEISDSISDAVGYCHFGFEYEFID